MIIDQQLLISDAQAISASGANLSTNCINLSVAKNVTKGEPLSLVIIIDVAFAGTGTTMQPKIITATASDLTTGQKVLVEGPAYAKASLTAGRDPIVLTLPPLPMEGGALQYLGVDFVTDNTFETTGSVTAFFTPTSMVENNV